MDNRIMILVTMCLSPDDPPIIIPGIKCQGGTKRKWNSITNHLCSDLTHVIHQMTSPFKQFSNNVFSTNINKYFRLRLSDEVSFERNELRVDLRET